LTNGELKMLDQLPQDIIQLIYEYDPTFSQIYSKCIQKFDYTHDEQIAKNKWTNHVKFYKNGKLDREFYVDEHGNYHGKLVVYYNKNIWQISEYNNGFLDGFLEQYHLNGAFKVKMLYKNGKMISPIVLRYFDNGNLFSETNYQDGKRNGLCKTNHRDGSLKSINYYKNDKLVSIPNLKLVKRKIFKV